MNGNNNNYAEIGEVWSDNKILKIIKSKPKASTNPPQQKQSQLQYTNINNNINNNNKTYKYDKSTPLYKNISISKGTVNNKKQKPKKKKICYTCKPRGKILKHIIQDSKLKEITFHFDMHKRPIILCTPHKHYVNFDDMSKDEFYNMLIGIREFCIDWNIEDYTLSWNVGNWQKNDHFHVKIKGCEKIVNRMVRDHFKRLRLEKNYTSTPDSLENAV